MRPIPYIPLICFILAHMAIILSYSTIVVKKDENASRRLLATKAYELGQEYGVEVGRELGLEEGRVEVLGYCAGEIRRDAIRKGCK